MDKVGSNAVLIERMIAAYTSLGHYSSPSHRAQLPRLADTLSFLKTFQGLPLSPHHHPWDRLAHFFRLLLDTFGLVIATSGDSSTLTFGELSRLGKPAHLASVLRATDEGYADWLCSALFPVWTHSGGTSQQANDLVHVVPKSKKSCDFLIGDTLVECKRLHSSRPIVASDDLMSTLARKALNKMSEAAAQFTSTEKYLAPTARRRLLILDVSSYGDWTTALDGDMHITGLDGQRHVAQLLIQLATGMQAAADAVIVCWTELYAIGGVPFAITYRTQSLPPSGQPSSSAPYGGWTLEFCPMAERGHAYKELRLSNLVRPRSWLRATWSWLNEDCYSVGPVEHAPPR